jgi:hypothetical protein
MVAMLAQHWNIDGVVIGVRPPIVNGIDPNPCRPCSFSGSGMRRGNIVLDRARHHARTTTIASIEVDDHPVPDILQFFWHILLNLSSFCNGCA